MGIDLMKICHSNTTFKGVTPGPGAHCTGSLLLEVIFSFPDNSRSENLTFHIAPFQSGYQALLGREAFARFNAIPHYASLTLKIPGPCGIIIVNGKIERSLRAEESAAALAAHTKTASPTKAFDRSSRPRTRLDDSGAAICNSYWIDGHTPITNTRGSTRADKWQFLLILKFTWFL